MDCWFGDVHLTEGLCADLLVTLVWLEGRWWSAVTSVSCWWSCCLHLLLNLNRPHCVFQDKDFGKQTLHKGHANPPAEVTTSLKTYQHFTLEKAYLGEDFFWAFTPVAGDFIRIRFFTPVRIERLVQGFDEG